MASHAPEIYDQAWQETPYADVPDWTILNRSLARPLPAYSPDPAHPSFVLPVLPHIHHTAARGEVLEQLDQNITMALQEIDKNLSSFHRLLAGRILPSVKRYYHHSAPIRANAEVRPSSVLSIR